MCHQRRNVRLQQHRVMFHLWWDVVNRVTSTTGVAVKNNGGMHASSSIGSWSRADGTSRDSKRVENLEMSSTALSTVGEPTILAQAGAGDGALLGRAPVSTAGAARAGCVGLVVP